MAKRTLENNKSCLGLSVVAFCCDHLSSGYAGVLRVFLPPSSGLCCLMHIREKNRVTCTRNGEKKTCCLAASRKNGATETSPARSRRLNY